MDPAFLNAAAFDHNFGTIDDQNSEFIDVYQRLMYVSTFPVSEITNSVYC